MVDMLVRFSPTTPRVRRLRSRFTPARAHSLVSDFRIDALSGAARTADYLPLLC